MVEVLQKLPRIRFPEFEEEWNESQLGQLATFLDGKRKPIKEGDRAKMQGEYPYYGASGIIDYVNDFIFDDDLILLGEDGANIVNRNSPLAFKVKGKIWVNNHAHVLKPKPNVFIDFLEHYLENIKYDKYNTGTAQPKLNQEVCAGIPVNHPTFEEQVKIGQFLSSVDKKIEQLKRKKELLEQYKKGVMQQIFSQEIRFKDDDGKDYPEWRLVSFNKVGEIVGGGTPDTTVAEYWGGAINWFTPTELKKKYISTSLRKISTEGLTSSSARLLPIGTVVLTTRATIGDVSITLNEATTNQGFQSVIVNKESYNEFIYYWLKYNRRELLRNANGSTFLEIRKKEIQKLKISLPSKPEQVLIGEFLKQIDDNIFSHNRILASHLDFKKGLLQQMFI